MTTESVTPVAAAATPTATETTAATTETTATVSATKQTSLVPGTISESTAAAVATTTVAAEAAADDGSGWLLYDGIKGQGEMPAWYLADKYKTVAEQAKAYPELQKRFGAFTGAPKEGKYEAPPMPEGVEGEFLTDHPVFESFTKWAIENQVSQKGYNDVLGMLAVYEASQAPNFEAAKKEIGDEADKRIETVSLWAKANLDAEGYKGYVEALGGTNAAAVFKTIEAITAKARQPARAKPGEIVGDEPVSPLAEIHALQAKINPASGKRFYEEDAAYRANVERKRTAYFQAQSQAA